MKKSIKLIVAIIIFASLLGTSVVAVDIYLNKYEEQILSEGGEIEVILEFSNKLKKSLGISTEEYFDNIYRNEYQNPFNDFEDYVEEYDTLVRVISKNKKKIESIPDTNGKYLEINPNGKIYSYSWTNQIASYLDLSENETRYISDLRRRHAEYYCIRVFDNYFLISTDNESPKKAEMIYSTNPNVIESLINSDQYDKYYIKLAENWFTVFRK